MIFSLKIQCCLPLRLAVGVCETLDWVFLYCSVEFLSLGALPSRGERSLAVFICWILKHA